MLKCSEGREWTFRLDVRLARELREREVLIEDAVTGELFQRLYGSTTFLCDMVWWFVRRQAEQHSVEQEQFEGAVDASFIYDARQEIVDAIVNFTQPHQRPAIEAMLAKHTSLIDEATKRAVKLLESQAVNDAVAKQIDQAEADVISTLETSGNSSSK
jgi:hypothetical protein